MEDYNDNFIWLDEPQEIDDTYCKRGESTLQWLQRSTIQRAVSSREFLNANLQNIPNLYRNELINRFSTDWDSTLFELIVARYLQELGAVLVYQENLEGGKRPDFTTFFPEGTIIVEAINPVINHEVGVKEKIQKPLLNYIESKETPGWIVCVSQLPKIGPNDSKKKFKIAIDEIFSELKSITNKNEVEFSRIISQGEINIHFYKTSRNYNRIAIEPAIAVFDNTCTRIEHAFDKKRKQVRNSQYPVILAINAGGILSEYEDFDKVLFGHTTDIFDKEMRLIEESKFIEDGLFTKVKNKKPTYAGVLAFVQTGLFSRTPPILYRNPRFKENLPNSLLQLEQRYYDPQNKIIIKVDSQKPNLIRQLHFPII